MADCPSLTDGAMKHSTRLNDGRIASQHGDGGPSMTRVVRFSGSLSLILPATRLNFGKVADCDMVADRKDSTQFPISIAEFQKVGESDATTRASQGKWFRSRQSQESGTFEEANYFGFGRSFH
jgi:hypothetical protein